MAMPAKDISGQKFSRLTVIDRAEQGKHKRIVWNCVCDCGNRVVVAGTSLRVGATKSCGCVGREKSAEFLRGMATTHGLKGTPIYRAYHDMMNRCYKPNTKQYEDYGGRGIAVCDRWREPNGRGVVNFADDMGERPRGLTLDRIDNENGYSPDNCRWADRTTQRYNSRVKVNSSGRVGVFWWEAQQKWKAYIKKNGKMHNIGLYDTFEAACEARASAEIEFYGVARE